MTTTEIFNYIIENKEWEERYNKINMKGDYNSFEDMAKQCMTIAEEVPSCTEEDIDFIIEDMLDKLDNMNNN